MFERLKRILFGSKNRNEKRWEISEVAEIMCSSNISDDKLAKKLGRTKEAIQQKRYRIRKNREMFK